MTIELINSTTGTELTDTGTEKTTKKTSVDPTIVDELRSEATMQLLQESLCPSLSGRTELTSQIGYKQPTEHNPSGLSLRVYKSTGTGVFNSNWIRYERIVELLQTLEAPFSWKALQFLYSGLSANSPGFFLAVLLNEGLVESIDRRYQWKDPADFLSRMKLLIKKTGTKKTTKRRGK